MHRVVPVAAVVAALALAGCGGDRDAAVAAPAPALAPVPAAPAVERGVTAIPLDQRSPRAGLALAPGVFLVQGIPPGQTVRLGEVAPSTLLAISNHTDEPRTFSLGAGNPLSAGMVAWERGYEALPDASWCRIEPTMVTIPAQSTARVSVVLDIPDRPELWGRKFAIGVRVAPANESAGLQFGLAGRVLVETALHGEATGGGPIALPTPAVDLEVLSPSSRKEVTVPVRNGTDRDLRVRLARINEIGAQRDTWSRLVTGGCTALIDQSWIETGAREFTIKPGATIAVPVTVAVPADAIAGRYEELLFIESLDGVPTGNRREPQGATSFVRVRLTVDAAAVR